VIGCFALTPLSRQTQLNPVKTLWALVRHDTANTAFADPEHPIATVRSSLRTIQHRPQPIDGCLSETGLLIHDQPP
jgi:hypothetical protein